MLPQRVGERRPPGEGHRPAEDVRAAKRDPRRGEGPPDVGAVHAVSAAYHRVAWAADRIKSERQDAGNPLLPYVSSSSRVGTANARS